MYIYIHQLMSQHANIRLQFGEYIRYSAIHLWITLNKRHAP